MKKTIYIFRYISIIAVICSLIVPCYLFLIGCLENLRAIKIVLLDMSKRKLKVYFVELCQRDILMKIIRYIPNSLVLLHFCLWSFYHVFISNKIIVWGQGVLKMDQITHIGHLKKCTCRSNNYYPICYISGRFIVRKCEQLKWNF